MRLAIIGAGGTGSAAARFLAREGHAVTVFERFTLDHDHGSSYGSSRIIRRMYPDALYTHMMGAAYALWEELEQESGEELFVRCGGLTYGRRDNQAMAQTEDALRANSLAYERLSPEEVAERFPPFRLETEQYAIWQGDSGFLRASQCVRAQVRLAKAAGAVLRENATVQAIRHGEGGKLVIALPEDEETFDRVLVTTGPWMADLLPWVKLPLTITRQYYAHFQPQSQPERFTSDVFPVWIDADTNFYGFPQDGQTPGVKVACHEHGEVVDPNRVRREMADSDREPLEGYIARRLPCLHGPLVYEKTCLYTNTPDEDFIIDAVPDLPGAFLCSGCSGHGFKFTVLLGQILANLIVGRPVAEDLRRFRLSRF